MDYEQKYKSLIAEIKERMTLISAEKEKVSSQVDKLSLGGRIAILQELLAFTHEFEESEDEKIRKEIISYIKSSGAVTNPNWIAWLEKRGEKSIPEDIDEAALQYVDTCPVDGRVTHDNINEPYWNNHSMIKAYKAGWLEKQSEQKPADNVEPKFKVGDFVVTSYGKVNQVITVDEDGDGFTLDDDTYFSGSWKDGYHLWTIQDAKDGDMLVGSEGGVILMFRGIGNTAWDDVIDYHCYYYYDCNREDFVVQKGVRHWGDTKHNQLKPATKEQRDLLFQKMEEAGYEWDAKKKELKKIEQKPAWSEEELTEFEKVMIQFSHERNSLIQFEHTKEEINAHLYLYSKKLLDLARKKILKDLPKLEKSTLPIPDEEYPTGFNGKYFCYKGYCVDYKKLFETLPKEE